jgi:hypothetical protein
LVVATAARPIKVPELQLHLGVGGTDAEELVGVWFPGAVGVAVAAAAWGILVLPLLPRFDGDCSGAVEELWRLLYRSLLQRLQLFLLWKFLQVMELAQASAIDLTVRVDRGVAPADAALAFARSRRSRRVVTAATSTRTLPLQVFSGDLAAACWCFVFLSGEALAFVQAAADLDPCRRIRGRSCNFVFFQGSFCNLGTAVQGLDGSCTPVFLT